MSAFNKNGSSKKLFIVIPFATTVISVVLLLPLFTILASGGLFTHWRSLGKPVVEPERIVSADINFIEINAVDDRSFTYEIESPYWETRHIIGQWREGTPSTVPSVLSSKCEFQTLFPSDPPGAVKDEIQFGWCPEIHIDVRYAIMEDGTVWRWSNPDGLDVCLGSIIPFIVIGVLVGIFLAIKQKK